MVEFLKKLGQREYAGAFLSVGATLVIGMFLNYGISALLSNRLSVSDFGIWSFSFQTVVMILVVFGLYGNGNFLLRELIKSSVVGNVEEAKKTLNQSARLSLLFTVIGILLYWLFRGALYEEANLSNLFFLGISAAIFFLVFGRLRQSYQQATKQNAISQLPERIVQPIFFLCFLFLWIGLDTDWTLTDVISVYAIASFLAFVIGLVPLKRLNLLFQKKTSPSPVKEERTTSRKHFFFLSLVDIIDTNIDLFLLKTFVGFEEVAFYSVAKRVASLVNMILYASNYTLNPIAHKLVTEGKRGELQQKIKRIVGVNIALATVFIILLVILKEPILGLFGEAYSLNVSFTLYFLMLLNQWLNIALGMPGILLNASDNERFALYVFSISVVLQIALAYFILPTYGIEGMAAIFCCITLFWNITLGIIAKKKTGVSASFFI